MKLYKNECFIDKQLKILSTHEPIPSPLSVL